MCVTKPMHNSAEKAKMMASPFKPIMQNNASAPSYPSMMPAAAFTASFVGNEMSTAPPVFMPTATAYIFNQVPPAMPALPQVVQPA